MLTILEKISSSGSTKWIHTIYNENPSSQTYASSILLHDQFKKLDVDYLDAKKERIKRIEFSREYLTSKKEELGSLTCCYCGKSNLIIEYEGIKVPNRIKATIDHIIPISKGGPVFDLTNIKIACGKCNNKKADSINWRPTNQTNLCLSTTQISFIK